MILDRTEAARVIDNLRLSSYLQAATTRKSLEPGELATAALEYRKFLLAVWELRSRGDRSPVCPNRLADAVWHEHILNSLDYTEFSDLLFGQYFHHVPHASKQADRGGQTSCGSSGSTDTETLLLTADMEVPAESATAGGSFGGAGATGSWGGDSSSSSSGCSTGCSGE